MTKEELIEMVDNTINENATRGITGKSLNLALNEIINAMGAGSGGSGALTIYVMGGEESEEQKAVNASHYAMAKAAVEAGQPLPTFVLDLTILLGDSMPEMPGVAYSCVPIVAMFDSNGVTGMTGLVLMEYIMLQSTIVVNEDGTTSVIEGMSTMSLRR